MPPEVSMSELSYVSLTSESRLYPTAYITRWLLCVLAAQLHTHRCLYLAPPMFYFLLANACKALDCSIRV